ncbi:MAG: hypothetical protein ACOVOW_11800, partial [Spirosomataceae bacterium]
SYGNGNKPVINNYKVAVPTSWVLHSSSIWKIDISNTANFTGSPIVDTNVGHLRINEMTVKSKRVFALNSMLNDWDFYCDGTFLYVLIDNPANYKVEFAVRGNVVNGFHGLQIYSFDLFGGGSHGVSFGNHHSTVVSGINITNFGGSVLPGYPVPNTRYGNGVQYFGGNSDAQVDSCVIENVYDVAFTLQGDLQMDFANIKMKNNKVKNCSQGFEVWVRNSVGNDFGFVNCSFESNIVDDCGFGEITVGRPQAYNLVNLLEYHMQTTKLDIVIKNNTFSNPKDAHIYTSNPNPLFKTDENVVNLIKGTPFISGNTKKPITVNRERKSRFSYKVNNPQNAIEVLSRTSADTIGQEEKLRINTLRNFRNKSDIGLLRRLQEQLIDSINTVNDSLNYATNAQYVSTWVTANDPTKYAKLAEFNIKGQYNRIDWLCDYMLWGDSEFPAGGSGRVKIQIVPDTTFSTVQAQIDVIEDLKMNVANISANDFVLVIESLSSANYTCKASLWFNIGKNNYIRLAIKPILTLSAGTNTNKAIYFNNFMDVLPTGLSSVRDLGKDGTATLVNGTVTVQNYGIRAKSQVFITVKSSSGTRGFLTVTINAGTGFTVTSSSNTDNSTFDYFIKN